ncbi:hypothetical protein C2E21_6994 [Chlorella sorokiniana]|uniref:Uncharacterized protein n=1 Tax=Chlorella sorokiniana TaxID=3076 RepID=A0A2P6TIX2_CHLSO|nr:hypothetical protein C2E21_6994 [Chlorella sorokiniana]|eukprot:PRW39162.1 hypothetical protein C2E21_6994 [Chlorella sorokiniana]
MAAAVLAPQPLDHHFVARSMKVQSFKGDHDMLVDRLIAASQRKEVAMDSLQERHLVPFFDSSEASATSYQALQPGRRASKPVPVPAHGLKRAERSSGHLAGSPPKKEAEVLQARHQRRPARPASSGSSAASGAASDTEMSSPPPQQRKPRQGKKGKAAPASATAGAQRASPARRRADPVADLAALRSPAGRASGAKAAPAPSKFAGPAFTNSPTPDCLPIPTSSLLLQEAADGLRSRLTL